MCETILQTFEGIAVFTVIIVGAFKTETCRERKKDLSTYTREWTWRIELALRILCSTTEMGLCNKDLHKTWSTVCILTKANSDLHDKLHSNRHAGLLSGAELLNIGRTV